MRPCCLLLAAGLLAAAVGCARRPMAVMRPTGETVATPGVEARVTRLDAGQGGGQALRVSFTKSSEERRFLPLAVKPEGDPATAMALSLMYRLVLDQGAAPRLALIAFEKDGGAWFRIGGAPLAPDGAAEARLPLTGFTRAQFAQDADPELHWDQVTRVQLGLMLDGAAEGMIELGRAAFTAEPYVPAGPLAIPFADPATWSLGKDPAASGTVSIVPEGPDGKPCMKFVFAFPGGRHMFVIPTLHLSDIEFDGYRALRLTYRAALPEGIDGLLVSVQETDHAQYYADPAPPASAEWKTVTIPFDSLKLGNWSKDENDHLDLNEIASLTIGLHGTAAEAKGTGEILVSGIELVP